jgi:hypothetical protein
VTALDLAAVHAALGLNRWRKPRPFGPTGLVIDTVSDSQHGRARIIITDGPHDDPEVDWRHASISRPRRNPDYDDLVLLKAAAWGDDGYAYQVFPARSEHVNIHEHALHLWGTPDGARLLPAFGANGSI